ncbi:sporulation protein YunB [Pseudogracilibacillus sp. SE30717A]|uniref:sporulation protein YunB n=1 Tax=Pseudogracilibacillus sp. SE30717A TaxID=3098293 RepID=UPI00300DDCC2
MRQNQMRVFTRRRSPPPVRYLLLLTTMIFLAVIILSLWLIDRGIRPTLMDIANEKTIEFATRTINSAVKSTENISFDDLVDIQMDNNGNVATLGWDADAVNRALRTTTERAEYFLYGMNKGQQIDVNDPDLQPIEFGDSVGDLAAKDPTVVEIPLGQATGNTVLANLGPKIPVHFEIIGSLRSDVVHEVKEFGVNAALVEIYIPVDVNIKIVVPFSTATAEVSTNVFIDSRVIMGDVPEFYNAGDSGGPSISVPRKPKTE